MLVRRVERTLALFALLLVETVTGFALDGLLGSEPGATLFGWLRELFGPQSASDPLYQAISDGRRYPGMEHWLPLFHDKLATLFGSVAGSAVSFEHAADEAVRRRFEQVEEEQREDDSGGGHQYGCDEGPEAVGEERRESEPEE